jgi:hypothetical protein
MGNKQMRHKRTDGISEHSYLYYESVKKNNTVPEIGDLLFVVDLDIIYTVTDIKTYGYLSDIFICITNINEHVPSGTNTIVTNEVEYSLIKNKYYYLISSVSRIGHKNPKYRKDINYIVNCPASKVKEFYLNGKLPKLTLQTLTNSFTSSKLKPMIDFSVPL